MGSHTPYTPGAEHRFLWKLLGSRRNDSMGASLGVCVVCALAAVDNIILELNSDGLVYVQS